MTEGFDAYMGLFERGRSTSWTELVTEPALVTSVDAVVRYASERAEAGMPLRGPWRVSREVCVELEARYGWRPRGGWDKLLGLLAGSAVLQAKADQFLLREPAHGPGHWSDVELRCMLIEAFTRHLVPPSTAAGLFLMLGVHPAWGLRLATTLHDEFRRTQGDLIDPLPHALALHQTFPSLRLEAVRHGVAATLAVIMETLRSLEPDARYPVEALGEVILSAAALGREVIRERLDGTREEGAPVFLDHLLPSVVRRHARAVEFALCDLLDGFLVPSHLAHRFDDQTFALTRGALDVPYRVDRMSRLESARYFARFLGSEVSSQVV